MRRTVLQRPTRPACQVSCGRGREGRNQRQEQKQKGSQWLPFPFPRASTHGVALLPLPLLTPPPGEAGRAGSAGLPGTVCAMGPRHALGGLGRTPNPGLAVCAGQRTPARRHRAPRGEGALLAKHRFASARTQSRQRLGRTPEGGVTACPGQPCRPGPRHEAQRGNALNLTAPRKYPLRPCRCRCTSSPCRTSAGDDAGRAAGSRYGSRRSHRAGGPGQSRRPAG